MLLAVIIGTLNLSNSGTLWPDGPRYVNAAAMIHDWLTKGSLLHPYEFAKQNYCQYPAFNIPYHPPVYPAFWGLFFLFTGMSYLSARVFIAISLGVAACLFWAILRRLGVDPKISFGCSILFLTLPEIVHWSRDTMSEIPALAFVLGGSYFFLRWFQSGRPLHCWAAFGLAELAFLSRVTTAGVIPAWFVFTILCGRSRQLLTRHIVMASLVYLGVNVAWVKFVTGFSKYETIENDSPNRVEMISWDNLAFYPAQLPEMVGVGVLIAGIVSLSRVVYVFARERQVPLEIFWVCWFFSYFLFQLAFSVNEQRYFLFALPALPGVISILFSSKTKMGRPWLAPIILGAILTFSIVGITHLPRGLVGYDNLANRLAVLDKPGNVFLAIWEEQDLIFRYRAKSPAISRRMIRSDRTLSLRLGDYTGVKTKTLVDTPKELVKVIREGRIRYLVTYLSAKQSLDVRPEDLVFAHTAVTSLPQSFRLIDTYPLTIEYSQPARFGQAHLWEYLGELPPGFTKAKTIIPTAHLAIECL